MSEPTCHCGHVQDEHNPGGPCEAYAPTDQADESDDCPCIYFELNEDADE